MERTLGMILVLLLASDLLSNLLFIFRCSSLVSLAIVSIWSSNSSRWVGVSHDPVAAIGLVGGLYIWCSFFIESVGGWVSALSFRCLWFLEPKLSPSEKMLGGLNSSPFGKLVSGWSVDWLWFGFLFSVVVVCLVCGLQSLQFAILFFLFSQRYYLIF